MLTQDVTEAGLRKVELRKAKIQAELASRAKSEFLANMSHELRTPLNGIIGFTDLVLKTQMTQTQHQYLSIINQSANVLLQIINDILDFSKIEAGKLELDIEQCDIFELNNESTDILSYQIHKKGLELLLHLSPELPRYIWVDKVRIKQVLVNLLSNAAKFTEKGEIKLEVTPLTSLNEKNEINLRFSVQDTGIGIKQAKQQKIFEAFAQEDISTTKKYGGTGLGLAISNSLLKMMGSHLQLESKVGRGSTFYFDIKVKAEMERAGDIPPIQINNALIVDDNENNRLILKEMLTPKGIDFEEATNGMEALQKIQHHPEFDLILIDYNMPFMDGLETIRKIRENFDQNKKSPSIILLLHSSIDETDIYENCKELDIVPMTKPIKLAAINKFFQGKDEKELEEKTLPDSTSGNIAPGLKIMIVEDNMINMLLAKTVISKISPKAKIVEANNGSEALKIYQDLKPDLIFMDIQLPGMNGYEVTKKIREDHNQEKPLIIALTAGNVKGEKEKCLESGMLYSQAICGKGFAQANGEMVD